MLDVGPDLVAGGLLLWPNDLQNTEKRPVVVEDESGEDTIAVRTMCYLSLSYDHRIIDGKTADEFLARIKHSLETDSPD